jgi:hypothetical protein
MMLLSAVLFMIMFLLKDKTTNVAHRAHNHLFFLCANAADATRQAFMEFTPSSCGITRIVGLKFFRDAELLCPMIPYSTHCSSTLRGQAHRYSRR